MRIGARRGMVRIVAQHWTAKGTTVQAGCPYGVQCYSCKRAVPMVYSVNPGLANKSQCSAVLPSASQTNPERVRVGGGEPPDQFTMETARGKQFEGLFPRLCSGGRWNKGLNMYVVLDDDGDSTGKMFESQAVCVVDDRICICI